MGGYFSCLQGGYDDTEEEHDPSSAENLVESSTGDQSPPQQEHAGGAPATANSMCRNICDSFKKCVCSNWCIGGFLEDGFPDDWFPNVMYYPMIVPLPPPHSPPPARENGANENRVAGTEADVSEKNIELGYDGKEVAETGVDGNVVAGTEADGSEKIVKIEYDGKENAENGVDGDVVAGTEADGGRISPPLPQSTPVREGQDLIQNNDTRMPDAASEDENETSLQEKSPNASALIDFTRETAQDVSALNSNVRTGDEDKAAETGVDGSEISPPLLQSTPARESEDLIQNNDMRMPDMMHENGTSLKDFSALNSDVRSEVSEYKPDGTEDDEFIKIVKIGYDAREAAVTGVDGSEISPAVLQLTPARESEELIQNNMRMPDTVREYGTSLQETSSLNSGVRSENSEYKPDGTEDDEFIKIVKIGYDAREAAEHWD